MVTASEPQASDDEFIKKLAGYADRKRVRSQQTVVATFSALVRESSESVPIAVQKLIERDLPRTFAGLAAGFQIDISTDAEKLLAHAKLRDILMAFAARSLTSRVSGSSAGYTQGMNFIAAVCLIILDGNAAEGFWLFTALVEDCVGLNFYANFPALLGLRATIQVVVQMMYQVCPKLSQTLGEEIEDFVAGFSTRFMLPLGVISLPKTCLLRLWHDLLKSASNVKTAGKLNFCHHPLVETLLSIFQTFQGQMLLSLVNIPKDEPKLGVAMQTLMKMDFPLEWKPSCSVEKMFCEKMFNNAEKLIRATSEDEELTRHARLPPSLVQTLHAEFTQIAASKEGIDRAALQDIVRRLSPQHALPHGAIEAVQQLFSLLDSDGVGRLNFLQLMTGLLILCSDSREEKLHCLFDLYDTSKLNKLDKEQLLCLAMALASLKNDRATKISRWNSTPALETDINECALSMNRLVTSPAPARASASICCIDRMSRLRHLWTGILRPDQMMLAERYHQRMLMMDVSGNGEVHWDEFCFGFFSDPELVRCLGMFRELVEDSYSWKPAKVLPGSITGRTANVQLWPRGVQISDRCICHRRDCVLL